MVPTGVASGLLKATQGVLMGCSEGTWGCSELLRATQGGSGVTPDCSVMLRPCLDRTKIA
jgi:hypothetical protein